MAEKVVSIYPKKKLVSYLENVFDQQISFEEFLKERKNDYQKEFGAILLNQSLSPESFCQRKAELKNSRLSNIIARNLYNCLDHFNQASLNPTSLLIKRNFSLCKLDRIMM